MKKTPMMLALAITLGAASGALADDKKQDKQAKEKPANSQAAGKAQPAKAAANNTAQKKENTALTGSYIKRDVKRNGVVTDGPNPVYVLDQDAVQTSGASDLSQVLVRKGFRR
jgi:hypothetical protein